MERFVTGWFDYTEPSLGTSLQGKQGVQGAYAIVRGGSSTSNLIEPTRTYSNHNITEIARCGEVCHMSSMCLNHPELVLKHPAHLVSQRTSSNLHEPQHHRNRNVCRGLSHEFGVVRLYRTFSHGAYALVQGGSSTRC